MKTSHIFYCFFLLVIFVSCSKDPGGSTGPVVTPPVDTSKHVTSLSIDPASFILLTGGSRQLKVDFTPANTTNKKLLWTSSHTSVATVDANGAVTAKAPGTATITATSDDNPSIKISANLTVLKNYEVHVVGYGPFENYFSCAIYWKNGVPAQLPGGIYAGMNATALVFSGNDLYIAGTTLNSNLWHVPTYWKNGVPNQLTGTASDFNNYARSIAVSGNTVYVAGYSFHNTECPNYCFGRVRASYWKSDGTTTQHVPLSTDIASTYASGIALLGGEVIVTGSLANSNFDRWATYWRNDFSNATQLTEGVGWYQTTAVATYGADVYIVGQGGCPDFGCIKTARLWKNNKANMIPLSDGTTDASANSLVIDNGIIYVCGSEKNAQGKEVAKYWKVENNKVTSFSLSDGTHDALANSITIAGEDIFVAGSEMNDKGKRQALYWRAYKGMSIPVPLSSDHSTGEQHAEANGIVVR